MPVAAWAAILAGLITAEPAVAVPGDTATSKAVLAQIRMSRERRALCFGWSDIACNCFQMSWTTCRTGQHDRDG